MKMLLDANPLEDIRNTQRISQVYHDGTAINRAAMHAKWSRTRQSTD